MRKLAVLSFLSVVAASAQSLSVGIIGGAPFTDVVNSNNDILQQAKSPNFTIGPAVRINLPLSLRFEVDALYRPYEFTYSKYNTDVSAAQWSFPVLLQYRFKAPVVNPFIEGGISFDHLSGLSSAATAIASSGPGSLLHTSATGIILGTGADLKIPFFRLSGEIRYTRDTVANFVDISNQNQAEILFGIHF